MTAKDNRLFVEAVLYRYLAGILLARSVKRLLGFWVIHTRHMRCSRRGVWQRIFKEPSAEAINEYVQIEITIVQAHQHSAGAKKVIAPKNVSVAPVEVWQPKSMQPVMRSAI